MSRLSHLRTLITAAFLIAAGGAAYSAPHPSETAPRAPDDTVDLRTGKDPSAWSFVVMPYIWFLKNDLTIGTDEYLRSDVTPFIEALQQYDYGSLFFLEAHKGNWAIYADAQFVKLSDDGRDMGFKFDSVIKQVIVEIAGGRKVNAGPVRIDLLGGLRYFWLDTDVRVRFIDEFDDKFAWVEPLAGLRLTLQLADRWTVQIRTDAGGFDLGSDFTWQLNAAVHYHINDRYDFSVGYRYLDIDHTEGSDVYDNTMSGPMMGLRMKF
jgi:hypothetical protein